MPSAKAISWAKLRVGLMALVALAILAVLIFLLTGTGSVFRDYAVIRTYMRDSGGLSENAPVRLNGILIGHVESVRLSNLPDSGRTVEVAVLVEERFLREIPADSTAAISAANLLGDKFINITK
ncbi:MAG: MCE family protein, partial [Acidobacteria bacterium]|nr:MCE family protein [Acidobacteriota bacterium]